MAPSLYSPQWLRLQRQHWHSISLGTGIRDVTEIDRFISDSNMETAGYTKQLWCKRRCRKLPPVTGSCIKWSIRTLARRNKEISHPYSKTKICRYNVIFGSSVIGAKTAEGTKASEPPKMKRRRRNSSCFHSKQ